MSIKHKATGLLSAISIAVISYFIIFFFAPDFSHRHFGIAFGNKTHRGIMEEVTGTIESIKTKK